MSAEARQAAERIERNAFHVECAGAINHNRLIACSFDKEEAAAIIADSYADIVRTLELEQTIRKQTNERLNQIGLTLFNYPEIPEGCVSNIQWRNTRAEAAERLYPSCKCKEKYGFDGTEAEKGDSRA